MKVVLMWYLKDNDLKRLRARFPKGTTVVAPKYRRGVSIWEPSPEDVAHLVEDADLFVAKIIPDGIWDKAKKVRGLVWMHGGSDSLDFALLKSRGIKTATNRGSNAQAVAEHAMALVLAVAKKIIVRHNNVLAARWSSYMDTEMNGMLLSGKTMAVLGLGEIGHRVAKMAKGFSMRVLGLRRHPNKGGENVDAVYGPKDLYRVLKQADVVVLAAALTRETRGYIGERELAVMKPTAILVNIARGNMVQEKPLHKALTTGKLGGFSTDVWWTYVNATPPSYHYPTPTRTYLQHLPNVVASPDSAARVDGVQQQGIDLAIASAIEFVEGKPMTRAIDLDLGY